MKRFAPMLAEGITTAVVLLSANIGLDRILFGFKLLTLISFFNRLQLPGGHSNNSSPAASLKRCMQLNNPLVQ